MLSRLLKGPKKTWNRKRDVLGAAPETRLFHVTPIEHGTDLVTLAVGDISGLRGSEMVHNVKPNSISLLGFFRCNTYPTLKERMLFREAVIE